jgi:type 1 fimbria pilin
MESKMHLPTPTLKIAVLDRSFVYVGLCHTEDGALVITNAQNIRRWGTTGGLGQLAMFGPQGATKLDAAGTVRAPLPAVIHLIDCNADAWPVAAAQAA